MTWAPCPHGVRTRGKKHTASVLVEKKLPKKCAKRRAGQPPERGEVLPAFPFRQLSALPAAPMRKENPHLPHRLGSLRSQYKPSSSAQQQGPRGSGGPFRARHLGVYAMQAFADQDIAEGQDAPCARLGREIENRARDVRSLACIVQDILQRANSTRQHLSTAGSECLLGAGKRNGCHSRDSASN